MKKYYIYSLEYKDRIFYIGKTIDIKKRIYKHRKESVNNKTIKEKFINKILLNGDDITISIIDEVDIGTEDFWETFWIQQFKSWGFKLCNGTSGGEGGDYWTGRKHTEETKKKLSKIRIEQIERGMVYKSIGEKNGKSKLKSEQVIEMRELRERGYSYGKLAKKYGISKPVAIDIIKRKKWKHI